MQLAIVQLLLLTAAAAPARAQALDADLGGAPSRYAELVAGLALQPAVLPALEPGSTLRLTCFSTPDASRYVGVLQEQIIHAPLAAVAGILDDVSHYRDLFPGLVEARVVEGSREGDRYRTAWEQEVPVFFLPNTRYELNYLVSHPGPGRVVYRYRLARAGDLTSSDGLVDLEALGPGETRFTEYDFYDASWGPVPAGLVWSESLRGMFLSDVAVKLYAENPGWTFAAVAAEAKRRLQLEDAAIERCVRERRPAASLQRLARREPG